MGVGFGASIQPCWTLISRPAPASSVPPIAKPTARVRAIVIQTAAGATAKNIPRTISMYGGTRGSERPVPHGRGSPQARRPVVHAVSAANAPEIVAFAAWLASALAEQVGTGQELLRLLGAGEEGREAFMQAWIDHLHQLADRARARRTGTAEDTDGARPSTGAPTDTGPAGSSSTERGQ
ncbi:hypothetical protein L1856_08990 [Streptomyces sp. Tue 6430]|nr:hypothetical protein [Streptomyces sp. Tue 6430]